MSHHLSSATSITSLAALAAALRELGYVVEVHEQPEPLRSYTGSILRGVRAHVIVRGAGPSRYDRPSTERPFYDVGWEQKPDGSVVVHRESMELAVFRSPEFDARLVHLAGVHATLAEAAAQGLVAERVDNEDGTIDTYVYANE